jgi:hypothetical protein
MKTTYVKDPSKMQGVTCEGMTIKMLAENMDACKWAITYVMVTVALP